MAKTAAIIITGIAIALLVIYGADVAAGVAAGAQGSSGLFDMDHKTRGLAQIGRAVQQECLDRSRMPSSA